MDIISIKGYYMSKMKRIKSCIIFSIFIIFFITFFLFDKVLQGIPVMFYGFNDITTFYNTVFQVQATIAVLSPTLISLVANFNREEYFGISMSKFVMYIKPYINYSLRTVFLFSGVLAGYILLKFKLFNSLSFIFIVTIVICAKMALDVLKLYRYRRNCIEELSLHVLTELIRGDEEVFESFQKSMFYSLSSNNYLSFELNIDLFNNAYQRILDE